MKSEVLKVFNLLKSKKYKIFGSHKSENDLVIKELESAREFYEGDEVPRNSFKQVFYPSRERVLEFQGKKIKEVFNTEKRAIFGARFFDLKAVALYNEVFKKDAYYKEWKKNLFIVGIDAKSQIAKTRRDFTLNDLEYVPFDIFFDAKICYAGTDAGEEMLKKLKISYTNLRPVGNISPRDRAEARELHEVFSAQGGSASGGEKSYNNKIWDELGKICIACGKCAIACPTCFCFDFEDSVSKGKACRDRIWGNCFYQDFSKIAGGYVFKDKIADRIRFWYMHKFLRIPNDYGMVGCVGCGRCTKVCPVGIDIKKNIKRIIGEK